MASAQTVHSHPLVLKLESIFRLNDREREAIAGLPLQVADVKADQDVVREGDRPSRSFLLLDGFAGTYKFTGEGKRQIINFHISGDMPDLQSLHLDVLDVSIGTITPCKVGFVQHETLRDLCDSHPRVTSALWRMTLIDGSLFREWTTNLGRRGAPSRMAHLFCELTVRMEAVGLCKDHHCNLPLTQGELADALGLSTVHVNRTLQELRGAGLIAFNGTTLSILDWDGLQRTGDFDPTYLHLRKASP